MEIVREIGSKGQVVIPKDIRRGIDLGAGDLLSFTVKDNEIIIKKKKKDVDAFLKEFFKYRKKGRELTLRELKKYEKESYDLP